MRSSVYSSVIGRSEQPFQIFIGGRGIGKTYSALRDIAKRDNSDHKFMLMRRVETEIEALCNAYANPFKIINRNEGCRIGCDYISREHMATIGRMETDEKGNEYVAEQYGYGVALSTFSKMRGLDFSDVDVVIFDEFIPEKHVHKINQEGQAFLHFYETVNRNREFEGQPPLRCYLLANAINLNNDILLSLGIVSRIADMKVKGICKFTDKKRGLYIELMENAEFAARKGETALYRLTGGTEFAEQALNNVFTGDSFQLIDRNVKLIEYTPNFTFGVYTVFTHKNTGDMYICKKKSSGVLRYEECDRDIMYYRFAPTYRMYKISRRIKFDDYATMLVFDSLTKRS